ncbi:MAG: hypothetical protein Q9N68_09510 [Gammaproteobacteria bacterium]|nr:hypothetical protein [Gammaproteobacteria bacterium]
MIIQIQLEKFIEYAHQVNPDIKVFTLSATSGEGLGQGYDWLKVQLQANNSKTEAAS